MKTIFPNANYALLRPLATRGLSYFSILMTEGQGKTNLKITRWKGGWNNFDNWRLSSSTTFLRDEEVNVQTIYYQAFTVKLTKSLNMKGRMKLCISLLRFFQASTSGHLSSVFSITAEVVYVTIHHSSVTPRRWKHNNHTTWVWRLERSSVLISLWSAFSGFYSFLLTYFVSSVTVEALANDHVKNFKKWWYQNGEWLWY